jgi:hypothetical protein
MAEAPPSVGPVGGDPSPRNDETRGSPVSADEIGDASFPASDPPAAWTWEVRSAEEEVEGKSQAAD